MDEEIRNGHLKNTSHSNSIIHVIYPSSWIIYQDRPYSGLSKKPLNWKWFKLYKNSTQKLLYNKSGIKVEVSNRNVSVKLINFGN